MTAPIGFAQFMEDKMILLGSDCGLYLIIGYGDAREFLKAWDQEHQQLLCYQGDNLSDDGTAEFTPYEALVAVTAVLDAMTAGHAVRDLDVLEAWAGEIQPGDMIEPLKVISARIKSAAVIQFASRRVIYVRPADMRYPGERSEDLR